MIEPRDAVALREGYHSPQVDVDVRLNTNESPEAPPEAWVRDVAAAAQEIAWHRYPDRAALALRAGIGVLHGLGPEWVFPANGSNEVLETLLLTYGGAGRTAAVWEPTYALHAHLAEVTGTAVAVGERTSDFALDLDEVRRVVDEARPEVWFLCSPNNPTGVVDDPESVRSVLQLATEREALLVVDEAYAQFAPWSATSLLGEDVPLVVTRTYSKTWAMAGARLGYLLGPPSIVAQLFEVVLPYHLDALKQAAGLAALAYEDEMQTRVARLVEERGRLVARLGELKVDVWPSGANFVLFRPQVRAGEEVWQALVDRSVLVRSCASWPRLEGCLRVTIGTPDEDDRFLDALADILQEPAP